MRKIYANGHFHTFDRIQPIVQAVVVDNGRFIDIGTTKDMLLHWKNSKTKVIDLQGKTVTPGLIDSHLHLSLVAENFINLDLTGITSKTEMLERIHEKTKQLQPGQWLLGSGWDENLFIDGNIPTISELDHVAPGNPLFLQRICQHAAVANTKAFVVSNYHPNMTIPEGGTIVLDKQTRQPTGLILESARDLISQNIPRVTFPVLKDAMRKAIQFAIEKGLTSIHTNDSLYLGGLDQTYRVYDELLNQEDLGLRSNLLINYDFLNDLRDAGMYTGFGNNTLQIGAVKLFADGAFGRRTAHLSEPYSDDPRNFGDIMLDSSTLYEIVERARTLNMPVAVHTIGDKALENVLDVLDQFPTVPFRDRLIHVQVLRKDLLERLAKPSRIADIQPRFVASDFPWVMERLGKERMKLSYAWKSLQNEGVICAGGSDAPVEPVNPLLGIHAAVTRKTPGQTHNGYNQTEKLSMKEAFQLFTELGAYPTNEEHIKGTISRGKLADMTVYSKNPFQMENPDELLETSIDMTIIGGEIKYEC
ncbi:amidohydrolase [Oceanobacillus senegalensis]|uniref:amidohydrolase n=1 Tax=Oceanobacillus senegalensis TaxID=1936063 RepID=UPI000A30E7BA|nr:amidohydrolase [Oceanobacillus senegalensis]